MDFSSIVMSMAGKYPIILSILAIAGSLVAVMTVIVPLTPTKKDDMLLEEVEKSSVGGAVLKFLSSFSLIQKK